MRLSYAIVVVSDMRLQEPKDLFGSRIAQYADPDGLAISVSELRLAVEPR